MSAPISSSHPFCSFCSFRPKLIISGLVMLGLIFLSYIVLGCIFIDNFCEDTNTGDSTINPIGVIIVGVVGIILTILLGKARNYNKEKLYHVFNLYFWMISLSNAIGVWLKKKNCKILDEYFIVLLYYNITYIVILLVFLILIVKNSYCNRTTVQNRNMEHMVTATV